MYEFGDDELQLRDHNGVFLSGTSVCSPSRFCNRLGGMCHCDGNCVKCDIKANPNPPAQMGRSGFIILDEEMMPDGSPDLDPLEMVPVPAGFKADKILEENEPGPDTKPTAEEMQKRLEVRRIKRLSDDWDDLSLWRRIKYWFHGLDKDTYLRR